MDIFSGGEHGAAGQARKGMGKNAREMRVSPKYINWMDEVLDGNIWLIYKTDKVFQRATADIRISYEDLSPHEKLAIDEAFEGKAVTTESFDNIFEQGTLSAVAPLKDKDGSIYGAILIHENISIAKGFVNSGDVYNYNIRTGWYANSLCACAIFRPQVYKPHKQHRHSSKQMIDGLYAKPMSCRMMK